VTTGSTVRSVRTVETARSLLFVPGTRPDRFTKAAASGADLVVIDLEDAVPDTDKGKAREAVAAWLDADVAAVRVNALGSAHHAADMAALAGARGLVAVVVPMADDPAGLSELAHRLGSDVPVVALVETALGVHRANDIAAATGVRRLAFGHLDLAADLRSSTDDTAMLFARSTLVLASRLAGLPGPVDGTTTALDDPGVAGADAGRARALGFTGKLCIHPGQVAPVNAAFGPTDHELAWAQRVVQAAASGGAVRVDGEMVDAPVLVRARRLLAEAGPP
jgi:citrate lyase subunit beta / citryl-CoA lyase